jgi:hypothetical protein
MLKLTSLLLLLFVAGCEGSLITEEQLVPECDTHFPELAGDWESISRDRSPHKLSIKWNPEQQIFSTNDIDKTVELKVTELDGPDKMFVQFATMFEGKKYYYYCLAAVVDNNMIIYHFKASQLAVHLQLENIEYKLDSGFPFAGLRANPTQVLQTIQTHYRAMIIDEKPDYYKRVLN